MKQNNDHLFGGKDTVVAGDLSFEHQDALMFKFRKPIPTSLTVAEVLQHLRSIKQIKEEGTSC